MKNFLTPKILGYSSFYLCVVKGTKMENRKNFRKIQKSEEIVEFFVMFNSELKFLTNKIIENGKVKFKKDHRSQK